MNETDRVIQEETEQEEEIGQEEIGTAARLEDIESVTQDTRTCP